MKDLYSKHINGTKLTALKPQVRGVVIHNDYGTLNGQQYEQWLYNREANGEYVKGWAALYVDKLYRLWYHPTNYVEWHCGNQYANTYLVGIEVNRTHPDAGLTDAEFIENEEAALQTAAEILYSYNLPVNYSTVNLHREYFATACPHRSWDVHVGKNAPNTRANQLVLLDYFIKRIKVYYAQLEAAKRKEAPVKATIDRVVKQAKKINTTLYRGRSKSAYFDGFVDSQGSEVRKRTGNRITGFKWTKKAGYSLKPGAEVYIFETHKGWGRIYTGNATGKGSNEWIWLGRLQVDDIYKKDK